MELKIKDRIALVTGASQGIGREIALSLAKEGAQVAITSDQKEDLEQVAREVKELGRDALAITADVKSEDNIKEVVNKATAHFGGMDILINNIGIIGRTAPFDALNSREWQDLFNINVMSGVNFTKEVLPYMRKKSWGRIVFIASERAIEPGINLSHYSMTKAAVLSLCKSLANELGKDNITVNSISPGVIVTPSWYENAKNAGLSPEEYASQFCRGVLKNPAIGKPEDIASMVCYLCSEAARWITGSNFRVDGGSVMSI